MSNVFFKNKLFNLFFSETWAFQVPREHDKISLLESLELWISVKIVLQQRVKNIRKVFFMIFSEHDLVLFVAIVAFGRKQFIMWPLPWNVLLLQTLNNDETVHVHFDAKKIKKHSWHYRIRKVLKRASGNSLKESYYCTCTYTLLHVLLLMYVPCQKSYFLDFFSESIWNFFAGNSKVAAEVVQISNGFFCIIFSCGTGIR